MLCIQDAFGIKPYRKVRETKSQDPDPVVDPIVDPVVLTENVALLSDKLNKALETINNWWWSGILTWIIFVISYSGGYIAQQCKKFVWHHCSQFASFPCRKVKKDMLLQSHLQLRRNTKWSFTTLNFCEVTTFSRPNLQIAFKFIESGRVAQVSV